MIGKKYQAQGMSVENVLRGLALLKSSYYYGEKSGKKGAKPQTPKGKIISQRKHDFKSLARNKGF